MFGPVGKAYSWHKRRKERRREKELDRREKEQEEMFEADHTQIGGVKGEFNEDDDELQPVEQHSPTQVHVPRWKTIVLGGSGGIRVKVD